MRYPLLFTYRDTLFGSGFVVEVVTKGRALGVEEPGDAFWIYGVNPGALAECGESLEEAHDRFRQAYTKALFDVAKASDSYEAFKRKVEVFFSETNTATDDWDAAVIEVRAGRVTADLDRAPAESPRSVTVTIKTLPQVTAKDNEPELLVHALAA